MDNLIKVKNCVNKMTILDLKDGSSVYFLSKKDGEGSIKLINKDLIIESQFEVYKNNGVLKIIEN